MQKEELRRAQIDLEFNKASYFELYDMAPAGYLTLSECGLILEANRTAETILGRSVVALQGRLMSKSFLRMTGASLQQPQIS